MMSEHEATALFAVTEIRCDVVFCYVCYISYKHNLPGSSGIGMCRSGPLFIFGDLSCNLLESCVSDRMHARVKRLGNAVLVAMVCGNLH